MSPTRCYAELISKPAFQRCCKCVAFDPGFVESFWPYPGPGLLPWDSGRGGVELAGVFVPVASLTANFVPECIFWNPVEEKHFLKYARAMAGTSDDSALFPWSGTV